MCETLEEQAKHPYVSLVLRPRFPLGVPNTPDDRSENTSSPKLRIAEVSFSLPLRRSGPRLPLSGARVQKFWLSVIIILASKWT